MALNPQISIQAGRFALDFCKEVEVESSWDKLTDVCRLELPRKLKFDGKTITAGQSGIFRRGDVLNIDLGYNGRMYQVFSGTITGIYPGLPVRFRAEDGLWQLKQDSHSKVYKSVSLRQLLTDICPLPFKTVDSELGAYRIDRASTARVLHDLGQKFGFPSFVREGTLYVGLKFWPELQFRHRFAFGKNIIESNLQYEMGDDIRVKVEAISLLPNNKKLKVEVGDPEGAHRTLHFYNITKEAELKKLAEEELKNMRFEGYRGDFLAFGEPFVQHGDTVQLEDPLFGHTPGEYLVKKVVRTFGRSGYRQRIFIDRRVA